MTTAVTAYTLAQLTTDVQTLIGDINATRYSTAMIYDAINYAIKQIAMLKGYTYIEGEIELSIPTSGTYVGQSMFPLVKTGTGAYNYMDYITIKKVMTGSVSSSSWPLKTLLMSTVSHEDGRNPEWRSLQGYPARWVLVDGRYLMTVPSIKTDLPACPDPFTMTFGYIQQPALLSSTSDTVDARIPYTIHQYIKYGAASWLLSLDNSDTQSLATSKLYNDTFMKLIGE